jgi:hypothetical protein
VRRAHENKAMTDYYHWAKANKLGPKVLTTKYRKSAGSILTTATKDKKSIFNFSF